MRTGQERVPLVFRKLISNHKYVKLIMIRCHFRNYDSSISGNDPDNEIFP